MSRKELLRLGDLLTDEIEEANLEGQFDERLARKVREFEFIAHFEGLDRVPNQLAQNGNEAHARTMDALSYILAGKERDES